MVTVSTQRVMGSKKEAHEDVLDKQLKTQD